MPSVAPFSPQYRRGNDRMRLGRNLAAGLLLGCGSILSAAAQEGGEVALDAIDVEGVGRPTNAAVSMRVWRAS